MQKLLFTNIVLLLWAAPVTAFRGQIHSDFTSYAGQYDTANIARFILTMTSFCICLAEIGLRMTVKPRNEHTSFLWRGPFPILFSIFFIYTGLSIFYSMNIIFGGYMYVQLVVCYLSVYLVLSDFRSTLEQNIKRLIHCFLLYSLSYIGFMLLAMLVDFDTVCPAGGYGTVRCVNTFFFPIQFGNLAAGVILLVYSHWIKGWRIHWIEWASVIGCLVWLISQRTRAVTLAFIIVVL
ncbi:MAG: hypothetical protein QGI45_09985, partial [Myxococcota bacterium]|nr:hypothetical protein [Myxococcota bacterium]